MSKAAHALADTLPPLLMAARQVAGAVMGAHGRRRSGPGDSFWQFRAARPGDAARVIDWRQSARSDHLQVRETEWAAAQTIHLWCDPSPTLDWHSMSQIPKKSERAMVISLSLAILLLRGGERVCPLGKSALVSGEHNLERVALGLAESGSATPSHLLAPNHCVVLASDFLQPIDHWSAVLKALSKRGVRGHLVHVMDPAEETFPYSGRVIFTGMDALPPVSINRAQDLMGRYTARMMSHCEDLTRLAGSLGWTHLIHRTDHPAQTALLALYTRLSEKTW